MVDRVGPIEFHDKAKATLPDPAWVQSRAFARTLEFYLYGTPGSIEHDNCKSLLRSYVDGGMKVPVWAMTCMYQVGRMLDGDFDAYDVEGVEKTLSLFQGFLTRRGIDDHPY